MHRAYTPTKGGASVPKDKTINELGKMAIHYIGTFSDYYPIHHGSHNELVYIRKNWTNDCARPQSHISLTGLKLKTATSHCGGGITNHGGVRFSKQDLLRIANAMDETDTLEVIKINQLHGDGHNFIKAIKEVIG